MDITMRYIQVLALIFLSEVAFITPSQYQIQRQNSIPSTRIPVQTTPGEFQSDEENNKAEATVFDEIQSFGGFGEEDNGGSADHNYFMDQYYLQEQPHLVEFGHVCENPTEWEQRYEKKDYKANRHRGQVSVRSLYQHVPKKDHYDFGYRRGNDHHYQERHEKAHPHLGQFHTKVKWGDKHGGHGEHYWDYNHHGHHGHHNEERGDEVGDDTEVNEDIEKVEHELRMNEDVGKDLVFNAESGIVMDRSTGQKYRLQPVYS